MGKRLAMTTDGKLTYCSASDANIGKGRCNHLFHQNTNDSQNFILEYENLKSILDKNEEDYCTIQGFEEEDPEFDELQAEQDSYFLERQYKNCKKDLYIKSKNVIARRIAAENGDGLEELAHDKDMLIRAKVASHGYFIKDFINDESENVRLACVQNNHALDEFIKDKSEYVRAEVANKGYKLDELINDESWYVRLTVAKQEYKLDKLINDKYGYVRAEVARQGYGIRYSCK